jgi:hypothetical protein
VREIERLEICWENKIKKNTRRTFKLKEVAHSIAWVAWQVKL